VISSFFSLVLFVFAPALIQFIYGKSLLPASLGLRIMAFSVMFSFMNSSSSNLLFSLNKEKLAIRILGVCVVFVIASNLLVLPFWSYLGACLTTLLPELLNFILQYKAIARYLKDASLLAVLLKFAVLSLGVVGISLSVAATLPLALQILVFLAAYAVGIYLLRIFQPDEIAFVKDHYFRRSPALA
jgi:O-antigen/teichoic acid export membrane protein